MEFMSWRSLDDNPYCFLTYSLKLNLVQVNKRDLILDFWTWAICYTVWWKKIQTDRNHNTKRKAEIMN